MKFLFIAQGFPGVDGARRGRGSGIGTYLGELTKGLVARGHACDVLIWGNPEVRSPQVVDGVVVHLVTNSYWPIIERFFPDSRDVFNLRRKVRQLDERNAYDWIEINSEEGIGIGVQKDLPGKTILRVHTTLAQMLKHKDLPASTNALWRLAREQKSFALAERMWLSSEYHLDQLDKMFQIRDKARIAPIGIDIPHDAGNREMKSSAKEGPTFLIVGSPDKRKGFDLLRPILESYAGKYGACSVVIVSGCSDEKKKELNLADPFPEGVTVEWRDELSDESLFKEYARATVLLHVARYESFGLPLIEAAAMGLPVVTTPVGIAPDLLSGELSGFLIDGRAPDQCATALSMAIRGRSDIGEKLHKRYLSGFTRNGMVDTYLNALGENTGKRGGAVFPRTLVLSSYAPDHGYGSNEVVKKIMRYAPRKSIMWCSLKDGDAGNCRKIAPFKAFPVRGVNWRLHKTALGLMILREIVARRRAREIAGVVENFAPEVLWLIVDNNTVDVAFFLQEKLSIPMHLTFHDAPEVIATNFCNYTSFFARLYLERVKRLSKRASGVDMISEELEKHVKAIFPLSPNARSMVFPSSVPAEVVDKLSKRTRWDANGRKKIALCGGIKVAQERWQMFLDRLAKIDMDFEILVFSGEPVRSSYRPENVSFVQNPYVDSEHELLSAFRTEGIDACYLGLWQEPEWRLFVKTSLSSKLTSYAAAGLPVIFDGPEESVAWRLIKSYGAGIMLGDSAEVSSELRGLFTEKSMWESLADGSVQLWEKEFLMDVKMPLFVEHLRHGVST